MRIRPLVLGALAAAAVAAAVPAARVWYTARSPARGPLEASPRSPRVSVRVGERVEFSARGGDANGYNWRLWGRSVSSEPTWSYAPGPEEAGWQQVTLEVTGRNGTHVSRSWDVGVVAAVPPEIEDIAPAAGPVGLALGEPGRFRCRAHLPGGRPSDRLVFEWTIDDRPVLKVERAAAEAESELVLPPGREAGLHRLRLHVTEDGRSASIVDWAVEVGAAPRATIPAPAGPVPARSPAAAVPAEPAVRPSAAEPAGGLAATSPSAAAPPALFTTPGPPRAAPLRQPVPRPLRAQLIRTPGPRHVEKRLGERLVLEVRVEPEGAAASYRWAIDGLPVRRGARRLEYAPRSAGRHRVEVVVQADKRTIGRDAWVVSVLPAAVRVATATASSPPRTVQPRPSAAEESSRRTATELVRPAATTAAVPAPAMRTATAASLAEVDVRRWLDEYARAWSRKDIGALRRMGQVQSAADAAQLERYFRSVDALQVEVRVLALRVDGGRASVEFERIDTITDPSGRHQQLRLPPIQKEIERTPEGLRFSARAGQG